MRDDGNADAEDGRLHVLTDQRLVAIVVWMRDQRDAGGDELRTRRVDLHKPAVGLREANPVERPGLLPIFELGLGDSRAEVHVPQRRGFELIRQVLLEQPQERELRDALRVAADRRVGHRPVHRQAELPPQRLEGLLVLERQRACRAR